MNRASEHPAVPETPPEIEDAFARPGIAYRRQLAVGVLLAVLLLVAMAGGLAWKQYTSAQRTALGNERSRALLAGSVVDTYFRGELAALRGIAGAPSVVTSDTPAMQRYFKRLQQSDGRAFSAGLGWVDSTGIERVSSASGVVARKLDVSDRSYFRQVMATGRPYVSEAVRSRTDGMRVIVMAVPTRDASGRVTGVLSAALLGRPFAITGSSLNLGGAGVTILDRDGRSVLTGSAVRAPAAWSSDCTARASWVSTRGLDGGAHHVVAYASSAIPGWTIVIDQPRAELFADARRGFLLELALVAAASLIVLFLIGFVLRRGRREAERERARAAQRRDLDRILGSASLGSEVSDGLVAGLSETFPGALCIVALEAEDHQGLALSALAEGAFPSSEAARELVVAQAATLAFDSGAAIVIGKEADLRATLPGVHQAMLGAAHSFYATPLVNRGGDPPGRPLPGVRAPPSARRERAGAGRVVRRAGRAGARPHPAFEREHEVAVRLQRSLLSDRAAGDRGRRADRPLQRRRRRPPHRRRLVRRRAGARTASCTSPSATSRATA